MTMSRENRSGMAIGRVRPEQATPVLHDQRDVRQVEPLDEGEQHAPVEMEAVGLVVVRLVGTAEAGEIGRHHAPTGRREDRDHAPVEIGPGRLAVQAQEVCPASARAFVEIVDAQAAIAP